MNQSKVEAPPHQRLFFVVVFLLLGIAALYLSVNLMVPQKEDPDEGAYLMVARLLNNGYAHSSFSFDQFWLFSQILGVAFRMFDDSLFTGRVIVVAFSLSGLLGMVLLARQLGAGLLAAAAVIVGVIEPYYLAHSRLVMSDVPGVVCIIWAIFCMAQFCRRSQRIWLGLSGALTAAALVIKPLTVVFAVMNLALWISHRTRWREGRLKVPLRVLCLDVLVFAGCGIIVAAPSVNLLNLPGEFRRTVLAHWIESRYDAPSIVQRSRGLLNFLARTFMWLPFAVLGVSRAARFDRRLTTALVVGELGSAALLLELAPFFNHYTLLSPVLTVFAVLGLAEGVDTLKQRFKAGDNGGGMQYSPGRSNKFGALNFWLGAGIGLLSLPWLAYNNWRVLNEPANDLSRITAQLEQHSAPETFWMSDNAIMVYLADRLMPPSAMNLAFHRPFKGYASPSELRKVINRNRVEGIILTSEYSQDPKLISWIRRHFPSCDVVPGDSPETTAYVFRRKN